MCVIAGLRQSFSRPPRDRQPPSGPSRQPQDTTAPLLDAGLLVFSPPRRKVRRMLDMRGRERERELLLERAVCSAGIRAVQLFVHRELPWAYYNLLLSPRIYPGIDISAAAVCVCYKLGFVRCSGNYFECGRICLNAGEPPCRWLGFYLNANLAIASLQSAMDFQYIESDQILQGYRTIHAKVV